MPVIPRSQGVLQRPTTEVGFRAPSIAQSQIIPKAIQGLGQDLSQIGDAWQRHKQKQQDEYDASQALDFKNKLKDFENQQRLDLAKAPADQNTINNFKQKALEERQEFIDSLSVNYEGNRRLQKITKQQSENALVNFEFGLDKELLQKQRKFQEDTYTNNIMSIKKRYETAVDVQDFIEIERDLEEEMQTALKLGTIDFRDIDRQQEGFRALRMQRQEQLALDEAVRQTLSGELIVDPKDKKVVGRLDDVYNNAIASGEVEDPIAFGEQFATSTGIVPKQFKSFINGQILAGTPENRVRASISLVDMLESDKKGVINGQIPDNVETLAYEIKMRNDAGLSPSDSVKFAVESLEKNKSVERQVRIARFNNEFGKDSSSKKYQDAIDDIVDDIEDETGFLGFSEATAPDEMAAQVRMLARDYYLDGMELDSAMEKAKNKALAEWHITDVGEKRFQRFAPEKLYPGMTSKEIQSQAIQQAKKYITESLPNIKKEIHLQVEPNSITTGRPLYYVSKKTKDGIIEPVLDNQNLPILFQPDIAKTERYKAQSKAREPLTRKEFERKGRKKRREKAKFREKFGTIDLRTLSLIGVLPK